MTAIRKTTITGTILAAAFAMSISGAAVAGQKAQNQTGGTTTPPGNVVATDDGSTSANTAGTIQAVNAYLLWKKRCADNLLPRCE